MSVIERSNPKAGVGQISELYLEYFSSCVHFSKLKRRTRTWVQMTKYDLTLTSAEGQTEKEVCVMERSNPKAGVVQIVELYFEYFSSCVHFSKLKRKT